MILECELPESCLAHFSKLRPSWEKSKVFSHSRNERGLEDLQVRTSLSADLKQSDLQPIKKFLDEKLRLAVENSFQVPLGDLTDIHMIRYEEGHFFAAHRDRGGPNSRALFTVVGLLKRPKAGGELIIWEPIKRTIEPKTGSITVFPSDILHEGAKVTAGIKQVFVCWFNEPLW